MKIDRRNPMHWVCLLLSAFWVLLAIALRPFRRRSGGKKHVILYGHKLSGNLLALYRQMSTASSEFAVVFLTMDSSYHRVLIARGEPSLLATSFRCLPWLVTADAVISDHGLHALQPLLHLSDMKFFDVWHAIPFKGFDADDFRAMHRYDETWVASPLLAKLYVDLYEFPRDRVVVTGYARTDRLVREKHAPRDALRARIGLPANAGKVVLFAPTWKQDSRERSLFPFDVDAEAFCRVLSEFASCAGATVVLRTHLNSGPGAVDAARYERLVSLPYADYPDTEEILLATDVLVCDWSSIAFDYLLLERPTIFLDVPAPFRKGFTLGPEHRYGEIVRDLPNLISEIDVALGDPHAWMRQHRDAYECERERIYGEFADGQSAVRCVAAMHECMRQRVG